MRPGTGRPEPSRRCSQWSSMSSPSDPTAAEDAAVSAGTPQAFGSAPPRRRTRRIVVGAAVVALLGASRLLEIDTASRRVVRITAGLASVHGVIVVPSLHWVFATATGTNQLVALDETSGAVLYRAATGDYPDGLTYVASTGQLWISNESGGTETVLDAATGHTAGTVELGGEAGNVRYDPVHDRVLADVQTRNQIAVIDPHTRTILARGAVPGCDHDHGLILDPASTRAFVACDGNAQLVVLSLPDLRPTGRFPVGGDPDVFAIDPLHHVLYVAAESGVLTTLDIHTTPGRVTGRARLGENAHVVAVDPTSGQAFFPVLNKHGRPMLLITSRTRNGPRAPHTRPAHANPLPPAGSECLDLDSAESDPAGVGLQADEAGRRWSGRQAAGRVGVDVVGHVGAVEGDVVGLTLGADLELVPLPGRVHWEVGGVGCRGEAVDGGCLVNAGAVVAAELVDLDLEPEVGGDECGVVVALAVRVWEADEHPGVVIVAPPAPFQFEDEIGRCRCGVPEHAEVGAGDGFHAGVDDDEPPRVVVAGLVADG